MPHQLVFVMGATNAGKTTFMAAAARQPGCGTVEVGKLFRAKYPPEYFKGSAAPAHTQHEAVQMMLDGIEASRKADNDCTFVDGQPREPNQVEAIFKNYSGSDFKLNFWHLYASANIREARAMHRDRNNADALALSMKRLTGDIPPLYDTLARVSAILTEQNYGPSCFLTFDTGRADYDPDFILGQFLGSQK